MIRIAIDRARLEARIKQEVPDWFDRAATETGHNLAAGRTISAKEIWSEVKLILADLQHMKCGYCERRLGASKREWSIDHYRPRKRVSVSELVRSIVGSAGGSSEHGYYYLAYDPANYVATCLDCNSGYKDDYFPIAGSRQESPDPTKSLRDEDPYLLHPLDPDDLDPEQAITFDQIVPVPTGDARSVLRAKVTVKTLGLNQPDRLDFERARTLVGVHLALTDLEDGRDVDIAREKLEFLCSPRSEHTNCARSHRRLFTSDRAKAQENYLKAHKVFVGKTDPVETHLDI